ncbi:hypothetical protein AcV7_005921 [Taiwanofungus camphoratus]|nr:hypothetical protein AcV7_005921 [Antrodia cinnamomea]
MSSFSTKPMPRSKEVATGPVSAQAQQEAVSEGIENFELPRTLVTKIARSVLPDNAKMQKEVVLALLKASTVFINYLAATAHDVASSKQHKSISASDVLKALEMVEMGDMVASLQTELQIYRDIQKADKSRKGGGSKGKGRETEAASISISSASMKSKTKGKDKGKEKAPTITISRQTARTHLASESVSAAQDDLDDPELSAEEDGQEQEVDRADDILEPEEDAEDADEDAEEDEEDEDPADMMAVEEEEINRDEKGLDGVSDGED